MVDGQTILFFFIGGVVGIICLFWCCKHQNRSSYLLGVNHNNMLEYNNPLNLENNGVNRRRMLRYLEMNPNVIHRLAHRPYEMVDNIDSDKECIICMDKIGDQECKLNCGHSYHYECIKEWAYDRRNNSCPQCRGAIIDYLV